MPGGGGDEAVEQAGVFDLVAAASDLMTRWTWRAPSRTFSTR